MLAFAKSAKAGESGFALPRFKKLRLPLGDEYVIGFNSYLAIPSRVSDIAHLETYLCACVMVRNMMIIRIVRWIRHYATPAH
jgi:hypothetical protein